MQKRDTPTIRRKTDPPRGILKTAVADEMRYGYERYYAAADLDLYVEHYWAVEWDLRGRSPERVAALPHPSVHMVFERGGRSRIRGPAKAEFTALLEGQGGVFAVKFRPAGFYPFARVAITRFTDKIVRVRDVTRDVASCGAITSAPWHPQVAAALDGNL